MAAKTVLALFNGNDQFIDLTGVTDPTGAPITGATISAVLVDRKLVVIPGTAMVFADVSGAAGSYTGPLPNLTAAVGTATLQITGSHSGSAFYAEVACTVSVRTL